MKTKWIAAALAALTSATLIAQGQAVFRSGVQYVAVDVVVTDKSDRPITDLKKEDFRVTEGGKPQSIADFQFVSVPASVRTAGSIEADKNAPEPDVVTNTPPSKESRLFVLVIDDMHLVEQNIVEIKKNLIETINGFEPDDEVAMVFVSFSNMSINFTRNRAKLLDRAEHVRGALGFGLDSLASAPAGAATAASTTNVYSSLSASRFKLAYAQAAMRTLMNVVHSLEGAPHSRRAIFYFSGGTTIVATDPADPDYNMVYGDDQRAVMAAAARAGVPIYSIDPRGHITPDDAVRGGQITSETLRRQVRRNLQIQRDNLSELAINTGGRAVVNASDMKRMIHEVIDENSSFYLLGYYPEPLVADGKFHELNVKVGREGAIVRARKGYIAPTKERSNETTASVLEKAIAAGVNVAGLPLRVTAAPIAAGAKGVATMVTAELAYPAPFDGSRRIDDTLELSIVALDPDAKVKMQSSRTFKLSGSAPGTGDFVFLLDDAIELPSQALTLRVGVASQALGKAGTGQIALEIPKPSDSKLQMSGVAIGLETPARATVLNGESALKLLPFQPTTTREFKSSDSLKVHSRLFWKNNDAPAVTVTVAAAVGSAAAMPVTPAFAVNTVDGHKEGVIDAQIPLKSLSPGRYHLVIDAKLPNRQTVHRVIPFEVRN